MGRVLGCGGAGGKKENKEGDKEKENAKKVKGN